MSNNLTAKILLVEDDETLVEMYIMKFKEENLNLLVAKEGEAGLALAQKELPGLILLDIMMPKMDGFAVLTALKKSEKTKEIPVLMLSNLGQEADIAKGKALGAADYIVKSSMTPAELVAKIRTYL
ncbi:MAG: hypothetical protein A3J65_00455 [Candidatus Buchananbacteria bacterium RIFCSPHIGHO2_02_FULL_45_11b]|uniref:Response regulatory domain-containing protein n=4 Tax=Candidatus Buchananiibacteriota TaxID=1817903 RepID=A0A1G1YC25_9BACT|nr:MAG: hypothetical protein A2663_01150 [Candidatus Buchananbacteria bacterium RIFCSPHIGHO2_01_FULL_46_12]OGY49801.1 MAG: hypothetical protein A3J65_00455 [Candidatus Buchananbacteria bacterium RIFCSPHIGHO2_02_FULL_45_11b]OGY53612.1 MAG: hypothetical protein A3B15_03505 [Candidatus Buchananbacteria bacterium RIFCSPLOWO2_01_FULL_45_31]OGY57367.1 MAG: hypothetical protein A3H67_04485 [Candidatus Buchananbacteria bacterium RIFCSPLOWO2_02_FULL_46_11b]